MGMDTGEQYPMSTRKLKIVFIGNSIVNGFPYKRSQCFASLFREGTGYEAINKGVNGETSPGTLLRFEKDVIAHKPDRVYLLGGTNDFIYHVCTPEETLEQFRRMADLARSKGIDPVLLIPLMIDAEMAEELWISGVDYKAVAEDLKLLRELMLEYGLEEAVTVIDTQEFYRGLYTEETKRLYLRDGLHPTEPGHRAIADFLLQKENR